MGQDPHVLTEDFGLTPELLELVKREEGWRPAPYICPAGYPTIGYGHVIPSLAHPPITEQEGERLLMGDLMVARNGALKYCPVLANHERRLAAITDFVFNLGAGRLKTSTLRRRIMEQDWPEAATQIRRWVFGGGRKLPGLVRRREVEASWLLQEN